MPILAASEGQTTFALTVRGRRPLLVVTPTHRNALQASSSRWLRRIRDEELSHFSHESD